MVYESKMDRLIKESFFYREHHSFDYMNMQIAISVRANFCKGQVVSTLGARDFSNAVSGLCP